MAKQDSKFDSLKNSGIRIVNPAARAPKERTIIVVGVARSGTSIVAGALFHLGVFIGNKAYSPVFEDLVLSNAFEAKNDAACRKIIEEYNRKHSVWAWKRPSMLSDLQRVDRLVRNPHYVIVFRDIFAIANRNEISMRLNIKDGMKLALDQYEKILEFIATTESPAMLVSNEKLMLNKINFLEQLLAFTGLSIGETEKQAALVFISPDPGEYLDKTRLNKINGAIRVQAGGVIRGWAKSNQHTNPVNVTVSIDGNVLMTLPANQFREDLKGNGHPTGICGFEVDLTDCNLKKESWIGIRGEGDIVDLENSPISCADLIRLKV